MDALLKALLKRSQRSFGVDDSGLCDDMPSCTAALQPERTGAGAAFVQHCHALLPHACEPVKVRRLPVGVRDDARHVARRRSGDDGQRALWQPVREALPPRGKLAREHARRELALSQQLHHQSIEQALPCSERGIVPSVYECKAWCILAHATCMHSMRGDQAKRGK